MSDVAVLRDPPSENEHVERRIKVWCGSSKCMYIGTDGKRRPNRSEIATIYLGYVRVFDPPIPFIGLLSPYKDGYIAGWPTCPRCMFGNPFSDEAVRQMYDHFMNTNQKQVSLTYLNKKFNNQPNSA